MLNEYRKMINDALDSVDESVMEFVLQEMLECGFNKMPVVMIGNGGSADIGDHWSCDFTKGINQDTDKKINVRNLGSNMAIMTAIANDISYEDVFSKQIEWLQDRHAYVIAISSSGSSPNIVKGLKTAMNKGYSTLALVGFDGGTVLKEKLADDIIHVNSNNYGVVEDCHHMIMHMLAQEIRKNYCVNPSMKL